MASAPSSLRSGQNFLEKFLSGDLETYKKLGGAKFLGGGAEIF